MRRVHRSNLIVFGLLLLGALVFQAEFLLAQEIEEDEAKRPFTVIVYVGRPWFYEEPEGPYCKISTFRYVY